jgi:signal peptidase I
MFEKPTLIANRSRDGPPREHGPPEQAGQAAPEAPPPTAKPPPKPGPEARPQPSVLRELSSLLIKIVVIGAAVTLVFTFIYGLHRVSDADMTPAIKDGDLILYYRLDKDYAASDLLLLSFQGVRQVARVIATQGDTVDVTENGLMINGAYQQELNIYEETPRYETGAKLPITLGANQVFVLGDSRRNATDSRVYGAVNTADTLGTVIAVVRRRNL